MVRFFVLARQGQGQGEPDSVKYEMLQCKKKSSYFKTRGIPSVSKGALVSITK